MTRVACETWCKRAGLAAAVVLCAVALASPARAFAQAPAHDAPSAPQAAPASSAHGEGDHAAGDHAAAAAAGEHGSAEAHEASPWGLVGKILNFVVLVGVVVYFARTPFARYLADRAVQIREDLSRAAEMKEEASRQIAEIDAKLKLLPADLDALHARGTEEVAAEEVRINEAAAVERERLLEQTRREIDLQLRLARRELVTHAADLSVRVARERIRERITNDDQARLVDRYMAQVKTND